MKLSKVMFCSFIYKAVAKTGQEIPNVADIRPANGVDVRAMVRAT